MAKKYTKQEVQKMYDATLIDVHYPEHDKEKMKKTEAAIQQNRRNIRKPRK